VKYYNMEHILIEKIKETDDMWQFGVHVGEGERSTHHVVDIDKNFLENLSTKAISPEALVKISFEFLLQKESKESILKNFNIEIISTYFPEYEEEIKKEIGK